MTGQNGIGHNGTDKNSTNLYRLQFN